MSSSRRIYFTKEKKREQENRREIRSFTDHNKEIEWNFGTYYFVALLMYEHVCGCGSAASFASLQVCLPFFPFSVFFYARANIIMCLSFSSRVLRYKNLLCNISVIQRITKKFQGIRIICLVKVCLLALKGLLLHPQSREMRHFRQCY